MFMSQSREIQADGVTMTGNKDKSGVTEKSALALGLPGREEK